MLHQRYKDFTPSLIQGLLKVFSPGKSGDESDADYTGDYPPWDVNQNGVVDITDVLLVGGSFGKEIDASVYPNPDVNGDGEVDILDLVLVGSNYGDKRFRVYTEDPLTKQGIPGVIVELYRGGDNTPATSSSTDSQGYTTLKLESDPPLSASI